MTYKAIALVFLTLALTGLSPLPAQAEAAKPPRVVYEHAEVLIGHANGRISAFVVAIAKTEEQKAQGFMFKTYISAKEGMYFAYPFPQMVAFWMKNTLIPLDLIFIDRDNHIVKIAPEAKPMDETPIQSEEPVIAVLEIKGGEAANHHIQLGDVVMLREKKMFK